jgi:hypothetical protein
MRLAASAVAATAAALFSTVVCAEPSVIVTVAAAAGASAEDTLVTFFDLSQVAGGTLGPALQLRVQRPDKADVVVRPTEPWESWAVFGYNSVLRVSPTDLRLYYDCIEGSGVPPGQEEKEDYDLLPAAHGRGPISHRRICLARSTDGITWTKPSLGMFNRSGSFANNIILENSGVSVFIDGNPAAPLSQMFKMACSDAAYASPDGLSWTQLPWTPIAEDDTKPTAQWDPATGKYVRQCVGD